MDKLIYDRAESDVKNKTDKGYHNISDLNRVEEWCRYLADLLTSYNYRVDIATKTNWQLTDMRTVAEMERIRKNIETLRKTYCNIPRNLLVPSNLSPINITKANDIEKVLWSIDIIFSSMENNFIKSGVSRSGQKRFWQQRFIRSKMWIGMSNSIGNYNLTWNSVALDTDSFDGETTANFSFPLADKRNYIWATINSWNASLNYIDQIIGG